MRVIIEQDLEGCAGMVDWAGDLEKAGRGPWAARVVTDEVNAAVEGALQAGATELFCLEAHPFEKERVHPRLQVVTNDFLNLDLEADALLFVGRHAMAGVTDGVLNHTGSSQSIRQVRVNGRPFGELAIVAAWYGRRGVPVAFVSGDEAACREAREFLGDVETVAVKKGFECHMATHLSPQEACRRIREGARNSLKRLPEFKPFVVKPPVRWEIEFCRVEIADWVCRLPQLQRVDAYTTRYDAPDYESAVRMYIAQGAMLWRYDA